VFLGFPRQIGQSFPVELDVHLIEDNYATLKQTKARVRLAQLSRYHVQGKPTYASWLNHVER
jgi:hypothetical protein